MAILALRLSAHANAVSKLHARVARRLWNGLMPELPPDEVPIHPITNGVHTATWTAPEIAALGVSERPAEVDRAELWRRHEELRARLVRLCREKLVARKREAGAPLVEVEADAGALDPHALTIGFARRFATYKRAALIFRDPDRFARLLHQPGRPVQLVFAGKAHPGDQAGKELLQHIVAFAGRPEFRGKVVFVPDYDMGLARILVSGCDVWLNNPVRPLEASGTSGMKAAVNGVLNLSVLDGWWDEAHQYDAGFTIGDARDEVHDDEVAAALYDVLEQQVIPLFFARDEAGVPRAWAEKMVASAAVLGALFSSDRMVREYLELCYLPAAERTRELADLSARRGKLAGAAVSGPSELRE